jgi:septal ring factor EnvC (AmiA/AmiB activator)
MKIIKKYWALILGAILGIFGIVVAAMKKHDNKQADKIDQKIDDNNQQIDILTGKTEVIEDQRNAVKQTIDEQETAIEATKDAKETIQPETPKTVADAKENILAKSNKRGKRKNS